MKPIVGLKNEYGWTMPSQPQPNAAKSGRKFTPRLGKVRTQSLTRPVATPESASTPSPAQPSGWTRSVGREPNMEVKVKRKRRQVSSGSASPEETGGEEVYPNPAPMQDLESTPVATPVPELRPDPESCKSRRLDTGKEIVQEPVVTVQPTRPVQKDRPTPLVTMSQFGLETSNRPTATVNKGATHSPVSG